MVTTTFFNPNQFLWVFIKWSKYLSKFNLSKSVHTIYSYHIEFIIFSKSCELMGTFLWYKYLELHHFKYLKKYIYYIYVCYILVGGRLGGWDHPDHRQNIWSTDSQDSGIVIVKYLSFINIYVSIISQKRFKAQQMYLNISNIVNKI